MNGGVKPRTATPGTPASEVNGGVKPRAVSPEITVLAGGLKPNVKLPPR
jgi:hypothetical protein